MGKKKVVKKTKELSVAIAESSAMSGDSQQQITPRKRGRPRKIISIVKDGEEEVSAELKKLKTNEVEESQGENKKEDVFEEEKNLQPQKQQQQPTRSRARRKSKPRKSC
ncbi:hypothetical protein KY290_022745 [Solanum tuberosum]|nr:hypothetical protein KY284_021642 [Solanum tuberosum]KAH0684092.1 hypothetical protein KY289_021844 [Solanum tuberosum]KAH0694476.1 hypothetical protein KY285_021573 [Solanum tuberosum]KAH0759252.1 hypothetical protein KY290_022745 [Solanum tuberosum]